MDTRTSEQILEHYEVEREIADRLRNSSASERQTLYTAAYDELFTKLPHHPLIQPQSQDEHQRQLKKHVRNLAGFVDKDTVFVEVGPGDCSVSLEVAKVAKQVFAIDVSNEVTKNADAPTNFQLIISNGSDIPIPPATIDIVYSDQLMEHLHPDDALEQLVNIYAALKPGGAYFCITPNRLSGPHDVSRHFDDAATGLHLKEYSASELDSVFRAAGFSKTRIFLRVGSLVLKLPLLPYKVAEAMLATMPHRVRKLLTHNRAASFLLGVKLVATK
ncbi:MAG TPA: class I SAM-dependent methyltransferase [Pyrinomonadaceae bacterium]|nr:class I SAM-dependent methyltransferase [Pyrinomonadaceae bacterium]